MIRLKSILTEQTAAVDRAYARIVAAAREIKKTRALGRPEPQVEAIHNAIASLRNSRDVQALLQRFRDGKTGYRSFEEFINTQYRKFVMSPVKKLIELLNARGLVYDAEYGVNAKGQLMFAGDFRFVETRDPEARCEVTPETMARYQPLFKQAIAFWRSWLSDPVTRTKMQRNWANSASVLDKYRTYTGISVDQAYRQYFQLLNNLKLEFYHCAQRFTKSGVPTAPTAYAFVYPSAPNTVHVNASEFDDHALDTLIHEIQHLLYYIKPINPAKQISNVFVSAQKKPETATQIKNTLSFAESPLDAVARKYGISVALLEKWKQTAEEKEDTKPGYICAETEKMSNIMAIRKHLAIKPGQNITVNMLLPYIKLRKHHHDMHWIILCWALNGFGDLQQILNRTNQLAANSKPNADNVA